MGEQEEVRQAEEDDDEDPEVVADGWCSRAPLEDPASSTEPVNQSTDAA